MAGGQPVQAPHGVTAYLLSLVFLASAGLVLATTAPPPGPPSPMPSWVEWPGGAHAITTTEITVEQYLACVEDGACDPANHRDCNSGDVDRALHPMNCVNWFGATQYCGYAGGRLCAEDEWIDACGGAGQGRGWPYGYVFESGRCNVQSMSEPVDGLERASAEVASMPGCQGGLDGLYDMAGNVSEWLGACKQDYCKFRGAGYLSNDPVEVFSGCGGVCAGNKKPFMSGTVGIRCCRDLSTG